MATPVCRTFTRPKLIHGIEWKMFYVCLLGCMALGYLSIWNPRRLLLLPIVYFGPYALFRWAGSHDPQWTAIYPSARRNRRIWRAGADPTADDPKPPKRVLFRFPKFNA